MNNKAKLEALLFQYGEPMTVEHIARIIGVGREQCEHFLEEYKNILDKTSERGLTLIMDGKKVQLVTKPELEHINQRIVREEFRQELSPAALEVLTIVVYLGPIMRSTVDYIRGVNSSFTLRNLLMRGLIERERKGNAYSYHASFEFLRHMGLRSVEELPEYEKYKDILERFEVEAI